MIVRMASVYAPCLPGQGAVLFGTVVSRGDTIAVRQLNKTRMQCKLYIKGYAVFPGDDPDQFLATAAEIFRLENDWWAAMDVAFFAKKAQRQITEKDPAAASGWWRLFSTDISDVVEYHIDNYCRA